jgi:hypothetical protein
MRTHIKKMHGHPKYFKQEAHEVMVLFILEDNLKLETRP